MYWVRPVTIRILPEQKRGERPRWEVSIDGRVIGWLYEHVIGKSTAVFIKAIGVYPIDGRHIDLQNSTSFRERLERLIEFDQDPERFRGTHLH